MRSPLFLLFAASLGIAAPSTYRVAAQGGTHSSLQAAIDACPSTGCRIELPDSLYEFSEPVSIRGKSSITIIGARSNGARPILAIAPNARKPATIPNLGAATPDKVVPILWEDASAPDTLRDTDGSLRIRRYTVKKGTAGSAPAFLLTQGRTPDGKPDASLPPGWLVSPYPKRIPLGEAITEVSGFPANNMGTLHAGLFRIDSSRQIHVEHLEFAGGGPLEVMLTELWAGRYTQMSNLAAIALIKSFRSRIIDCEFHDWSVGVRTYDANPEGLASDLMSGGFNANDLLPLADPGKMGGHAIERNLAHDNRVFVELEASWDLASEIRFNRVWNNGRTRLIVKGETPPAIDQEWQPGGFAQLKDAMYPTHVFQGNSMVGNTLNLGWIGWRASNAQLAIDNVIVWQEKSIDWRELLPKLGGNQRSNWIAGRRFSFELPPQSTDSFVPFCKTARCEPLTPVWGSPTIDAHLVGKGWFGDDLGAVWSTSHNPERIRIQDQTLGFVTRSPNGWTVLLPIPVELSGTITDLSIQSARTQKIDLFATETYNGTAGLGDAVLLDSLVGRVVAPGVNLVRFEIPAKATDSVWRVEMALQGTDGSTGKKVHSNIGNWIVRPLGKQLQVAVADDSPIQPGGIVEFVVSAKDSIGGGTTIPETPILNAAGWTIPIADASPIAARKASSPSGRFAIRAKAPSTEGISQVVFWTKEEGRLQAIPGAVYVQVGNLPSGTGGALSRTSPWRLAGITRTGTGWVLEVRDADLALLSNIRLSDAAGRTWQPTATTKAQTTTLNLPRLNPGTYFLRMGGRTQPFALIP